MTNPWKTLSALLFSLLLVAVAVADDVTFDFEPLGTIYGNPAGMSPGDFMFHEYGADLYVDEFFIVGTPYFHSATIDPAFTDPIFFGNAQTLAVNNVGIIFDFSSPGDVFFEYLNQGGSVNLQVNGFGAVLEGMDLASMAGTVAPGVTMTVTVVPVSGGGHKGVVTLTGPVTMLRIGGQELWLDTVRCNNGYVEGISGDCDYIVDHQSQPVGTTWGANTHSPGDLMFVEDGIPVFIGEIDWGTGTGFIFCDIQVTAMADFGFDRVMNINNVSNTYKISDLGITVESVSFEYVDFGGMENLQVNGATLHIGDLPTFPVAIAPGVTLSVTTYAISGGGERGEVVLTGDVQLLLLAGQEFMVDNICVVFDDASDVPLAAVGGIELRPNYPNPFNPNTTLRYSLAKAGHVRLSIMDIAGRRLAILVDEVRVAGDHQLVWRGLDDRGRQAASGLYFVLLESDGQVAVRKMAMLK